MKLFNRYIGVAVAAVCLGLSLSLPSFSQAPASNVNRVPALGLTDKNGATQVNTSGINNSYSANAVGLVTASSATDVACLIGSATRTIHVTEVSVSGTGSTAVNVPVQVLKRASLNTGGATAASAALPVAYPYWSSNTAATAVPTAWTSNPTIVDSAPGVMSVALVGFPLTTTGAGGVTRFPFGTRGGVGQPTLLGATQALCVNFTSNSVAAASINVGFEWTED